MPLNVQCKRCANLRNDWCDKVHDSPDHDLIRDCQHYRTLTHADRIRAMTDEELAAYLGHASLCVTIQGEDGGAWCSQYGNCNECIRDWLREEATQ